MIRNNGGAIINMSSIAGLSGIGLVHYSTAKGGLLGLTRQLARDLAPHGIRVNAVAPGYIDTPMTEPYAGEIEEGFIAMTPLGRVGQTEEIAAAALYLASDESSFTTGQWLSPNGGIFIG